MAWGSSITLLVSWLRGRPHVTSPMFPPLRGNQRSSSGPKTSASWEAIQVLLLWKKRGQVKNRKSKPKQPKRWEIRRVLTRLDAQLAMYSTHGRVWGKKCLQKCTIGCGFSHSRVPSLFTYSLSLNLLPLSLLLDPLPAPSPRPTIVTVARPVCWYHPPFHCYVISLLSLFDPPICLPPFLIVPPSPHSTTLLAGDRTSSAIQHRSLTFYPLQFPYSSSILPPSQPP